jgi:iron complex outermembrane receptor protein
MRRLMVVLGGIASFALVPAAAAQGGGTLTGTVTAPGGAGVSAARVQVVGTGRSATTAADGSYRIRGVPAGTYTVEAGAFGFASARAQVSIAAGGAATQDFRLAEAAVALAPLQAIIGSRAQHTAEDELAVPVDVITAAAIAEQGVTETAQILQAVSPSVNFFHQSVSDATDIVRPFTLRGLSPDETLVLVNGKRYHRTALVHIFGAGMGAGSSGVDMNTLPASAIDRIEVLRDGAAAQYGSDAIGGVVNVVLKHGPFAPQLTLEGGRYQPNSWSPDGAGFDAAGAWGLRLGRGWVTLMGEFRDREPTNRAGADYEDQVVPGDADQVDENGRIVAKHNAVPQPTYHWGDGLQRDYLGFVNALFPLTRQATTQLYAFGGYGWRHGVGNGYFRHGIDSRNWPSIYPQGFLPAFAPHVVDASGSAGVRGAWSGWLYDLGGTVGHNLFRYNLEHTLNTSLGPCLDTPCAPGPDGVLGTADDPGIPNQTRFDAGALKLTEAIASLDLSRELAAGLASPLNLAAGVQLRRENYQVVAGERASWIQGFHPDRNGDIAPAGSQVFPGFRPTDAADAWRTDLAAYLDLEADLVPRVLANVAARWEHYSDFGSRLTGKLAMRFQPTPRWTLRGAVSTGFRAPSLSQSWFSSTVTNFAPDENGDPQAFDIGIFPVSSQAAQLLGATPLRPETSVNASAGMAFTPFAGLNLTADWYYIDLDHRILLTTSLGTDSVAAILHNAGLAVDAAQYFTNAVHTRTQGVDLTAEWRRTLVPGQTLTLGGVFNWTRNHIVSAGELPPALEGTGAVLFDRFGEGGLLALEKERPQWRSTLTGTYAPGPWRFLARASSYGKVTSALYSYSGDAVQTYGSRTLLDVEVGRSFTGRGRLSVGARNLLDTFPDRMSADNGFGLFIYPPASPFGYNGRYVYARMEIGTGH